VSQCDISVEKVALVTNISNGHEERRCEHKKILFSRGYVIL